MRTWVFNDNDSGHRGVWHVAKGKVSPVVVPEKRTSWESNLYGKHKKTCPMADKRVRIESINAKEDGYKYYVEEPSAYHSWMLAKRYVHCDCGIGDDGIIGKFTRVTIYPEHEELQNVDAICGQVQIYRSGGTGYSSWTTPKGTKPGDIVEQRVKVKPPYWFKGDVPPGPTCSRCLKKAEDS